VPYRSRYPQSAGIARQAQRQVDHTIGRGQIAHARQEERLQIATHGVHHIARLARTVEELTNEQPDALPHMQAIMMALTASTIREIGGFH
jgi:hypothetical protein